MATAGILINWRHKTFLVIAMYVTKWRLTVYYSLYFSTMQSLT